MMIQYNTIKQHTKLAVCKMYFEIYWSKFMFNFGLIFCNKNSYISAEEIILFISKVSWAQSSFLTG